MKAALITLITVAALVLVYSAISGLADVFKPIATVLGGGA